MYHNLEAHAPDPDDAERSIASSAKILTNDCANSLWLALLRIRGLRITSSNLVREKAHDTGKY